MAESRSHGRVAPTVTLVGRARTWAQRDAVVAAAWWDAVMAVIDELEITG